MTVTSEPVRLRVLRADGHRKRSGAVEAFERCVKVTA
jgi:hypothetical protein